MKKFNKLKSLIPLALIGASSSALAVDQTATFTFETLPDITIAETRALDFGANLTLTQADTCAMEARTAGSETLTDSQLGITGAGGFTTAYTSSGDLSGTSCSGDGTVGIYTVSSYAGAGITVTLSTGTATEIAFVPAGFVVDHTAAAEDLVALTSGTGANAVAAPALTAYTNAGDTKVIVGGTITNQQALTAGDSYTTDFNIDVVYQ